MISNLVKGGSIKKKNVAHFKVAFVNSVPPNYLCSLCNELFKFPCHVNCCQTHYCQECIGRIKQMDRPCPECLSRDFIVISDTTDSTLKASVDGLKVYCPMRKSGCKWTDRLNVLDDHLMWGEAECPETTCRVIPVQCVSECGSIVSRGSMKAHLQSSCTRRDTSCKYCGLKESFDQLTAVHYSICHKYHVSCPNGCKMPGIERASLKSHLELECPFRTATCEFRYAGCGEEFRVTEQSRHMTTAMSTHISLLSTFTLSVQVENKELRSFCTRLEKVCASLQRDCARLAAEVSDIQNAVIPGANPKEVYQNDRKNSICSRRPLPPLPLPAVSQKFQTQRNQSYSVSSEPSPLPSPESVPGPQLGDSLADKDDLPPEDSIPPPLPSRNGLFDPQSSPPSTSAVDWVPNDSTDTENQLSPLSSEEDLFN